MNGRRLRRRLLLLFALLLVLLVPGTGLEKLHAMWFRAFVGVGLEFAVPGIQVEVSAHDQMTDLKDTLIDWTLVEPAHSHRWGTYAGSRVVGYLPLVLFASLTLATPLLASRRRLVLLIGLSLLHALLILRLALYGLRLGFAHAVTSDEFVAGCTGIVGRARELGLDGWLPVTVRVVSDVLEELMAVQALPILLWFALTWRHTDWSSLLPRAHDPEPGVEAA